MPIESLKEPTGSAGRFVVFVLLALLIAVADQVTKQVVMASIPLDHGIDLVPGWLNLVHVRNPGAAFGIFSRSDWDYRRIFFIMVSVAALIVVLWLVFTAIDLDWRLCTGYSLFFGGALGNLVDRIRYGEVIDFVDVYWNSYHWPAFNLADSALCVGVALFALHMIKNPQKQG